MWLYKVTTFPNSGKPFQNLQSALIWIIFVENSEVMSDLEKIQLFENKIIRTVWVEKEDKWYFAVEDVIKALIDSKDPKQYVKRMKLRDLELAKGWVQIVPLLTIMTEGGPHVPYNTINIIQESRTI